MPGVWVAPSFASQDMRSFGILYPMFDLGYGESAEAGLHRASGAVLPGLGVELAFEPRP